jgi:hypothetical protein
MFVCSVLTEPFTKMDRISIPSLGHMRTSSDCTLSHLHRQAVEAGSIVLLVTIFWTDVSSSQHTHGMLCHAPFACQIAHALLYSAQELSRLSSLLV